jgi:alpha-1,6-mannosyltransferase
MTKLSLSGILLLCLILALHVLPFTPIVKYTVTFIGSSLAFLALAFFLFKEEVPSKIVFLFIAASFIVRLSFVASTPIGSDDMYRYLWDGKVQTHGINPYQYAPDSPFLHHLASPLIPKLVNHPEMKTMYFPLSEWLFYFGFAAGGEYFWGYKFLLFLSDVLTLYGILLLLKKLNIPLKFILLYALCPMLFYEYSVDGHVDGFGLPLLVFSLYFWLNEKKFLGLALLGMSLSIKPTGLILLPIFFFQEKGWKERISIAVIPVAVLGVQFLPYCFGVNPFESLKAFTVNWTFNGFVFNLLDVYVQNNQTTRMMCGILLSIIVLLLSLTERPLTEKIFYAMFFLLLFSPIVHPWYVGWLAVLLPFARKWSGIVFVSLLSLTSFTYISYQLHGVWTETPQQWLTEYIPVVILLVWELLRRSARREITY